jgi:hypothetical protein
MRINRNNISVRRLDAIEIAALNQDVKEMYLKKLKAQYPGLYDGVLRLVAIEETRLLVTKAKASGHEHTVIKSISNAMEKARC